ncbi:large subunit of L-aminoadipate-semialdehyde dehydrogenase, partial [Hortaea werneckii]
TGKPKRLAFVSSTSALDTDYYLQQSEYGNKVLEFDNLEGSRQGLGTGYGQSKWVSEKIINEACKRGLSAVIVRSGYVLGDPKSGISNTDDFLVRMLKGCVQVGSRPDVENTINMVPVNHVARLIIASAFYGDKNTVSHVEAHPRLTFNEFLGALEEYGYSVPQHDYETWKQSVVNYVEGGRKDDGDELALLGLYHMVTGDLPEATKAPNLNDRNAQRALDADTKHTGTETPKGVTKEAVGSYLAFLTARGFMTAPKAGAKIALPKMELTKEQTAALNRVGGRGGGS